ncbi:MAG TPA: N-acetylneuraminate synthase family protein [Planctomycetota bacterium]|nr:N-acetylneuraminate synthase family protein [Planctomycetota bacterium]
MKIGSIDTDQRVLIVAEIGNNHEGRFPVAQELVRRAAEAGADAVKFQTFRTEHYVSGSDAARFARLKSFELSFAQFEELGVLARRLGLLFLSTPFDLRSGEFLAGIVDGLKIASGDNNFYPLLELVSRSKKPLIVSTGVSDEAQVRLTLECIRRHRETLEDVALLHCVAAYPVPDDQANLNSIPFLAQRFPVTIGYSDHTLGIDAALLAIGLGARIVEKHFTLDKQYSSFRDHQISADPAELKELVAKARKIPLLLGTSGKGLQPAERLTVPLVRRSIVAGRDLPAGHRLDVSDLTWIRPSGGLPPGQEALVVGKRLRRAVRFGEILGSSDVE